MTIGHGDALSVHQGRTRLAGCEGVVFLPQGEDDGEEGAACAPAVWAIDRRPSRDRANLRRAEPVPLSGAACPAKTPSAAGDDGLG